MCMKKKDSKTAKAFQGGVPELKEQDSHAKNRRKKETNVLEINSDGSTERKPKNNKNNKKVKYRKAESKSASHFDSTEPNQTTGTDPKQTGCDEVIVEKVMAIKPGKDLGSNEKGGQEGSKDKGQDGSKEKHERIPTPGITVNLKKCGSFEKLTTEDVNKSKNQPTVPIENIDDINNNKIKMKSSIKKQKQPTSRKKSSNPQTNTLSTNLKSRDDDDKTTGQMEELSRMPVVKNMQLQKQKFPVNANNMDTMEGTTNFSSSLHLDRLKPKKPKTENTQNSTAS